jgi:2-polyprenylphenol 6-hydroxylase
MKESPARPVEVAIVGGGIVGAALALLLSQKARVGPEQIVLVERDRPATPLADAPFDLRVSAISPANQLLLKDLGVWQHLDASRITAYQRMVVWHQGAPHDSPDTLRFDAAQMGEPALGHILENQALQAALLERCRQVGISICYGALESLQLAPGEATLKLDDGMIRAQLVVGADGAMSKVRDAAGITALVRNYGQRAIVATVRSPMGNQATAWQRFLDTGPLALLPLANGDCSIVWSAVDSLATSLMAMSRNDFDVAVTLASDGVLADLQLQSERVSFPLRRIEAQHYVVPGCVLVGDAAHVIHPLAGQGVNQGLQDAAALAAALAHRPAREGVAALRALRGYERARRSGNAVMAAVVDGFDWAFTGDAGAASWLAREGMSLVNRSAAAKRFFFMQAAAGQSSLRR